MNALQYVRELCGFYLILTLSATGLAKLWSLRRVSAGVAAERVFPSSVTTALVGALITLEIALAVLLALGVQSQVVGPVTACMFLAFGAYKLAVVARTGLSSCNCTGTTIAYKATRPSVLAAFTASMIQATVAIVWTALSEGSEPALSPTGLVALGTPIAVVVIGRVVRHRRQPQLAA